MKNLSTYKIILWDFDGVIMDSMPIRSKGFDLVLANYPAQQVATLGKYHHENGGLSRYHKFRYFFEVIRQESITEEAVLNLAQKFSEIMLQNLINKDLLIQDSISFIKNNFQKFEMHVVSGSDGTELNQICEALDLKRYFKSINGSPTPKNELVCRLIEENGYEKKDIVLIGDSINDYEAAMANEISFLGYNNMKILQIPYVKFNNAYLNSLND